MVLTTPGGLYRYDINDVVRVASFFNRTPLIEFVRKGRDVTNITGEKLHVNQVIDAMAQAQTVAGIAAQHYRAVADVAQSRYAFMIEFNGRTPDESALKHLLAAIDANLSSSQYRIRRKTPIASPPTTLLCVMRPGWFERRAQQRPGYSFKAQLLGTTPEEASETWATIEL